MQVFKKCSDKKEYDSYDHQKKIADILDEMNKKEQFSTIVTVPTGGGKTKIAADFCLKMLKTEGNKVLWLSDTIDLLIQSIERFQDMNMFRDINYQLICSTAVYDDFAREKKDKTKFTINEDAEDMSNCADIIFASVSTIINADKDKLSKWFEESQDSGRVYVIYDEVHHIGADGVDEFFNWMLSGAEEGKAVLNKFGLIGLTATVYHYDSPVKCFNKWFKNGYDETNGVTCSHEKYGVETDELINNRIEVVSISDLTSKDNKDDIKRYPLMKPQIIRVDDFVSGLPEDKIDYLAQKISKNYKAKNWNKTIIFVDGKNNALKLQKKLKKSVPCFVYTSDTASEVAIDLEKFKKIGNKSAKIMIAVDMVSEGFDVKDIETIYMFSKVESHILLRQRVGRVLRRVDGKDKALVYWQNYFDYTKNNSGHYNGSIDSDIYEDDVEIQRDIGRYRKGMQLPAGMYLERLPNGEFESERELYRRYEYLRILELFGLDIALEGVGYYEIDDKKIYARLREKKGYEQLHRVIRSDYFSLLMYKDKYLKFKDYAKALAMSEEELIENVKVNCFYMSNASVKDTKGKIQKKSFIVKDADIKEFYEWVVKNDLKMPKYNDFSLNIEVEDEQKEGEKDQITVNKDIVIEAEKIKKYMENYNISPCSNLLDGIKLHQEFVRYAERKTGNKAKVYPDMLTYGKSEVTYNEMLSVRALMAVGAVAESRERGTLFGVTGELALIGLNERNEFSVKSILARSVSDKLYEDDLLLYAQAIATVPNHIVVRIDDVREYQECLNVLELKQAVSENVEWDKVTREFIMALGLSDNDDIIRAQCKLFSNKLPRLLQYVIYSKAYNELLEEVKFVDDEKRVHTHCINEDDLQKLYSRILSDFGVKSLDIDLTPVKDVISDYRPYTKVIPYYQGIKPEFLCRMLNEMLRIGNKKGYKFYDAYGGSATISMNIDSNLELQQTYNDLGILNNALFKEIKDNRGKNLKARVEEFIDLIVNHTRDENAALEFLKPYMGILKKVTDNKYDFKNMCLSEIEDIYQKQHDMDVEKHNQEADEDHKWSRLPDRLLQKESDYSQILAVTYGEVIENRLREIEEYLHAILLVINRVFDEIRDKEDCDVDIIDLAFVFFVFHSMSERHFYNDATIDKFAKFIGTYEQAIDSCAEILQMVEIVKGKAEDLLVTRKDLNDCVWYHDIPYSETDTSTYSSDWFDEADFVDKVGACNGDYIVASRFNIPENRKGGLDLLVDKDGTLKRISDDEIKELEKSGKTDEAKEAKEKNKKIEAYMNKEKNIIKFFGRFVSEEFSKQYEDLVIKDFPVEDTDYPDYKDPKEEKKANPWTHIVDDKVAKYICFAFSQTEVIISEAKNKEVEYVKNHTNISENSIRRMLKNTQISDIEVEIMLTNMELDLSKMPVKQMGEESGIWYMPSFKTPSSYKIEPVTIIMEYEKFMMDMVIFLLAEKEYLENNARTTAAALREFYKKMGYVNLGADEEKGV